MQIRALRKVEDNGFLNNVIAVEEYAEKEQARRLLSGPVRSSSLELNYFSVRFQTPSIADVAERGIAQVAILFVLKKTSFGTATTPGCRFQ
jgi:hypothetical protein